MGPLDFDFFAELKCIFPYDNVREKREGGCNITFIKSSDTCVLVLVNNGVARLLTQVVKLLIYRLHHFNVNHVCNPATYQYKCHS